MSDFRIKTFVLGPVSTNCYLIYHHQTREAVVIDPANNAQFILNKCRELKIVPTAVLLTHGHFDHMMAAEDIRRAFHIPVYASENEEMLLKDSSLNLSWAYTNTQAGLTADRLVKEHDELEFIGFRFQTLMTPGHTAGSVCYYIEAEGVLLSGDTLFQESLGRTDLPTGSSSLILDSITEKLFRLPDDTLVYPGHGDPTTIGHEKVYNPAALSRG